VEEDAAFGPGNLRLPSAEIKKRVDYALAAVGLASHAERHPYTLSGGEKQLLALAGVLAMAPRYIVLDEPTSSLDPASRDRVLSLVRSLNREGIAIIHVTHNMEEVTWADRLVVMEHGRISAQGAPGEVFCRVEWLKGLGLAPPLIAELMWRLHGIRGEVNPSALTLEAAVEEIKALIDRLSGRGDAGP
jgi:biotin transport system ATP-binding protein/energy-coupling factor transport system ATP-binding protein